MKKIIIIKADSTFEQIIQKHGDFDQWVADELSINSDAVKSVDVRNGEKLPDPSDILGAIMTGAHSMVTEKQDWSEKTAKWIKRAVDSGTPFFGICYGHQLLAYAMGGVVDYNEKGMEIGTVKVGFKPERYDDPVFNEMPDEISAHSIHSQSVMKLPSDSVRLAGNQHEKNHVFRIGECAWGVQFHPEFDADIMRAYIKMYSADLAEDGIDAEVLNDAVEETPKASYLLKRFAEFCTNR
ncbi:glutamine amidotransferase class-I [Denitrovibrio acetiphilus DSM 12809]|uniref:Glutamine amidotransferase class-I n=1 Tax=Denitrovibrio acetiphilus (strain DSM 12809 / NBRC 114555 / N2460) TaxID=522772 RepID=D4H5X8_DENA2|nr:glutamine amidotransferase [Denitrovibrio acetiphilus]ADD69569.1 glutamine amidotransferase class-I [Denitrovibrio acetiphilus DSM 12809]